jgi:hypothetical protein
MSKQDKLIDLYLNLLEEYDNVQETIDALPRGYISTKVISGHTYHYHQWREGEHVLSTYVPDAILNITKQKIVVRKQNEELLRIVKADLKKVEKKLLKAGTLNEEQITTLKAANKLERLELVNNSLIS